MALISSKDKLIIGFSELFDGLDKMFDSSYKIAVYSGHEAKPGGPLVAVDSKLSVTSDEQPKGFVQMFEQVKGPNAKEYAEIALHYLPKIIKVGKLLLPHMGNGSSTVFLSLRNVGIIALALAGFAELVILKEIIDKDCSSSVAAARELLNETLEYTKTRIQRNETRFSEIEALIEKAKVEDFDDNSTKKSVLLTKLNEKIRVCKIDIDECIQKSEELFKDIESTVEALKIKLKRSAWAVAGFGVAAVAGSIGAIVATGGLAIAAGVAAGATGAATGGFSYITKLCVDSKTDFIVMKSKCDTLLRDVRRMEKRLKLHVQELQDCGIDPGISLTDFK